MCSLSLEVSVGLKRGRSNVNFMLTLLPALKNLTSLLFKQSTTTVICCPSDLWYVEILKHFPMPQHLFSKLRKMAKFCFWYQIGNLRTAPPLFTTLDNFDPKVIQKPLLTREQCFWIIKYLMPLRCVIISQLAADTILCLDLVST